MTRQICMTCNRQHEWGKWCPRCENGVPGFCIVCGAEVTRLRDGRCAVCFDQYTNPGYLIPMKRYN